MVESAGISFCVDGVCFMTIANTLHEKCLLLCCLCSCYSGFCPLWLSDFKQVGLPFSQLSGPHNILSIQSFMMETAKL